MINQHTREVNRSKGAANSDILLATIFEYMGKMSLETDIHKMLLLLADLGTKLVQADRCTVWLHNRDRHTVWTVAGHGVERISIPDTSGFVGRSIQTGVTLNIGDAYLDEHFNKTVDLETGYRTRSILCMPISNQEGTIIGAFQAINKIGMPSFTANDEKILTFAATYAGKSLESFLLQDELAETQKEIIETLGELGESRSQETGNHVKRVAEYSYALAKLAGLPEEEAMELRYASPMHDIGKVAIPDAILLKPGKLTDAEYETMKKHAVYGYEIFRKSGRQLLKTAAIIAHQHHERWDGQGYPSGLKEDGIHVYGRITAVADVFDALGSDRVYKKAWPLEKITAYFLEQRDRQFEGRLVDLFLDHLDEFLAIRNKYADRG
ncbi:GAF and HD-GYP domain-containing protein [Sporosarcina koreensis]|uniref:GAF and HD-GYP domain-containing protein n=1 Tax=Sporosarcina koreensis TaxID=334735 RepID=UPI000590A10A|nr:HD domain-containing phosphohydrolase [Sporosarcina koreensis]